MAETKERVAEVAVGDFVCLSDEQTIKDLMEAGVAGATEGLQLEVERIRKIREQTNICEWIIADLKGQPESSPQLHLLVKIVGEEQDVRIYWAPDDFEVPMSRGDLLNADMRWLFKEPENKFDFKPCDLEFTEFVEQDSDNGPVEYDTKCGELHGEYREYPKPSGLSMPQPATVVELHTMSEVEDPELLILEVGGLDEYGETLSVGGVVSFYQGSNINLTDITLVKK